VESEFSILQWNFTDVDHERIQNLEIDIKFTGHRCTSVLLERLSTERDFSGISFLSCHCCSSLLLKCVPLRHTMAPSVSR